MNDNHILHAITRELADIAKLANCPPPTLMAVSKTFDVDAILPVLQAGHRCFGENKVQEAIMKWPELLAQFEDCDLHLIGPLQTNKAKAALQLFSTIHTLDREKLAVKLAQLQAQNGISRRYFVQVNTGEEPQKSGITPQETAQFTRYAQELGLNVQGLMAIPPQDEPAAPHFALLAKLAKQLDLPHLSMGMSADYDIAVQQGATIVRIGSKIFGKRTTPAT